MGAALVGARVWWVFSAPPEPIVDFAGRMAVVEGRVADDPDRRASSVRVVVAVDRLNGVAGVYGKLLAVLPRDSDLAYNQRVELRGLLEMPEPFETNARRTFDYPGYLKARDIHVLMQHAQLRTSDPAPRSILGDLFALKHSFEQALGRVMQEPMSSLMEGFLLGEKSGLPKALTQAFVVTGLMHVVVLSGYNIGVVAEWTLRTLRAVLPRRSALVVAALTVVLFALMAGGGMATARAAIMGLIALVARFLRRPTLALRALAAAACTMIVWNPLVLVDVGFVLSVLATFGLITIAPTIENKLLWIKHKGLRSVAATTAAVQFYILPALLYYTGVLSFVSLPLNVAVLPLIPLAMFVGFVAGTLALLHPYAGLLPGLLADWLLRAIITLTEFAAGLPLASAVVPPSPAIVPILIYIPLSFFAWRLYDRGRTSSPVVEDMQ